MVVNYVLGLVSVLMVSAISLLGATALSFKEKNLQKYVFVFVSLAVGSLLGDAFIHLIPEAIESSLDDVYIGLLVVLGIIAFFMIIVEILTKKFLASNKLPPLKKIYANSSDQ